MYMYINLCVVSFEILLESCVNVIDSCGDRQCGACQGLAPRMSGDGRPVREEVIRRYFKTITGHTLALLGSFLFL